MTHAAVPPAMRQTMGLTDSLVRLSCGIEDTDDLIGDLDRAFRPEASDRDVPQLKPSRRQSVGAASLTPSPA